MPTDLQRAIKRKAAGRHEEWSLYLLIVIAFCVFAASVAYQSPAFATAIRWAGIY